MERISIASPILNGNERKYIDECIDTGWISANGRFIKEFEEKFAEFCGVKYALACSNGTVTLHLALKALGISPGDEVIMPTLTYIATANAVDYCGATPVFVDSESDTWNIDVKDIEAKITTKTKAIIPVHLYGLPCNMDEIMNLSRRYSLPVIEDAAEAHGAQWDGKAVGSMGEIGSFSFFGNKIITCGEGGMLTTNNEELYTKMKLLRSQGVDPNKRYWHTSVAYNYRMTNMQAAVGLAQLENVQWHLQQRQRVAALYQKYLPMLGDKVSVQTVPQKATNVYWTLCLPIWITV
ncbi:MAG: DegT/DnrJ/EryC1/StrS family aminotransferase [Anaerovorax sp.]